MKMLVFVPGIGKRPYDEFLRRLTSDLGSEWVVRVFDAHLSILGPEPLHSAANRLRVQVRTWAGDNGIGEPVDEVLLLGQSMGGLLVREAYLRDYADHFRWPRIVSRIVLLASLNAGFSLDRVPRHYRAAYYAIIAPAQKTIKDARSGSPFVTDLRLRWVEHFRSEGEEKPRVVQVLGDKDGLVTREDSVDIEYMPNSIQVDVPGATHAGLLDLKQANDPDERYGLLWNAVKGVFLEDRLRSKPKSGDAVYFILHGIRTDSYANWVGELRSNLSGLDPAASVYTPSYGYFTAFDFVVPFIRSRNLHSFLDWYSKQYVLHGSENMRFAGHSNGTYLLGRALQSVPSISFERIYLAGSVLPRDFPWTSIVDHGQITGKALNDRATRDIPVGWLCSALRGLNMKDIGTAGINGFDDQPAIFERSRLFSGGHGAALSVKKNEKATQERIERIAKFLHEGELADIGDNIGEGTAFKLVGRSMAVLSGPVVATLTVKSSLWVMQGTGWRQRGRRMGFLLGVAAIAAEGARAA